MPLMHYSQYRRDQLAMGQVPRELWRFTKLCDVLRGGLQLGGASGLVPVALAAAALSLTASGYRRCVRHWHSIRRYGRLCRGMCETAPH